MNSAKIIRKIVNEHVAATVIREIDLRKTKDRGLFMGMDRLIEQQIRRSQMNGSMDRLEGAGKPIPRRSGTNFAQSAQMSVVNGAGGSIQGELKLRREISTLEDQLKAATKTDERFEIRKTLMDKRLELSVYEEARRK
ncbi:MULTISPECIES: DnaJ family domain-containing protein [Pseudovibrio]|nr:MULTISPECIES: DnaJ family domain-containing protein [Pseudovibrio]